MRTIVRGLAWIFRRITYWLDDWVIWMRPTPEEQVDGMEALKELRTWGAEMRKRGVTAEEIRGWVREGRR